MIPCCLMVMVVPFLRAVAAPAVSCFAGGGIVLGVRAVVTPSVSVEPAASAVGSRLHRRRPSRNVASGGGWKPPGMVAAAGHAPFAADSDARQRGGRVGRAGRRAEPVARRRRSLRRRRGGRATGRRDDGAAAETRVAGSAVEHGRHRRPKPGRHRHHLLLVVLLLPSGVNGNAAHQIFHGGHGPGEKRPRREHGRGNGRGERWGNEQQVIYSTRARRLGSGSGRRSRHSGLVRRVLGSYGRWRSGAGWGRG
jgi:hypothetical protein